MGSIVTPKCESATAEAPTSDAPTSETASADPTDDGPVFPADETETLPNVDLEFGDLVVTGGVN